MVQKDSLNILLKRLWGHINSRRRLQFFVLLFLMVLTSFAEVFSLGAVIPFLGVLTSPDTVYANEFLRSLIEKIGINSHKQLVLWVTVLFGFAALLSGAMRLIQLKANTRLSFAAGADLSIDLYRKTLYQPYTVHVSRNSSQIIDAVTSKVNAVIFQVIVPFLTLISSSIIMIAILGALIVVNPVVAMLSFSGFGLTYFIIIKMTREKLKSNSIKIAQESKQVIKTLQEGLGGIRDVLIDGCQPVYCNIYKNAIIPLRRAQGDNQYMNQSPRYVIESMGMVLIASLAFWISSKSGGISREIPVLGALALGAQRLLPVLQQVYSSWSSIQGSSASLKEVLYLLDQPVQDMSRKSNMPIVFEEYIEFNNICYRYNLNDKYVLRDINIRIKKGDRVGIIGATGSGKSTLLDLLMLLLMPSDGIISVDGVKLTKINKQAWQSHLAHVPQTIFLADATIEENIAFGIKKEKIDSKKVLDSTRKAHIKELIESWPNQYKTIVGERGVRLSGGQRQRLGIARALYKNADVLIFDEATSALDNETEEAVMRSIKDLDKNLTIFIIAHRVSTLKDCDYVIDLEGGRVKRIVAYDCIVAKLNNN